jgi:LysR family transcriptional regulator (chromosome initiation inhibitor)
MTFDPDQLAALAAVVDEGTFDGAARRLQVTPSAVSQRIRALEQSVGQVLVRRSRPAVATPAGEEVVRLAAQVALLTADTWTALRATAGSDDGSRRLPVAVNADSLATWFPDALVDLPAGLVVDIRRADQDDTAAMLRDGTVLAAVTADSTPVQGCRVRALGAMRYRAMAAPRFRDRWFPDGPRVGSLAVAPVVAFGPDDALQHRFAEHVAGRAEPGEGAALRGAPVHHVPSTAGFVAVLAGGVGWGMVPEQEADAHEAAGTLVDLAPGRWLDVPLHWQRWSVRTPTLDDLTARVVEAAQSLRPVR